MDASISSHQSPVRSRKWWLRCHGGREGGRKASRFAQRSFHSTSTSRPVGFAHRFLPSHDEASLFFPSSSSQPPFFSSFSFSLPTLDPTNSISKLYMRDSCVADRKNNWPRRPDCAALPGGSASSTSAATCNAVFKYGPSGAFALAAETPASGFDSGSVCNPGVEGFFFIVYDDVECNPGKTPPAPKLVATAGAAYRGPPCNRAAFGRSSGSPGSSRAAGDPSSYRAGGLAPTARTGVGIGTALLILLLAGGACAAVFLMFRKRQAAAAAAAAGGGGGGGVQMGAPSGGMGGPPPPPPPGSYVPGAPAAGAAAPPSAGAGGAGAAPGGVQYSFAPGKDDGAAKPLAGSKPAPAGAASSSLPLPGGSDAVAGAGKPPGGLSYPKV